MNKSCKFYFSIYGKFDIRVPQWLFYKVSIPHFVKVIRLDYKG